MIKIALPADGADLTSNIFEHFGRAPYFLIITIENNEIKNVEAIPNPSINSHMPGEIPRLLISKGVSVLIVRGIGRRARYYLQQSNIEIITGAEGKIIDIVKAYVRGELKSIPYEPEKKWHEIV